MFKTINKITDSILKNPPLVLAFSFFVAIIAGALLLWTSQIFYGTSLGITDAIFTSTSAVTVTGLTVVNTAGLSLLSQIIILILIQIGGLGIMSAFAFFLIILRKRLGIPGQATMKSVLDREVFIEVKELIVFIISITLFFELIGTIFFFFRFFEKMDFWKALFFSVFHSISAFCNAGFMLFPDGFIRFQDDIYINLLTAALIILGGLGFTTFLVLKTRIIDTIFKKRPLKRVDLTTKIVIFSTIFLFFFGPLIIFLFEIGNLEELGFKNIALISFFQAVSARTAGFNTIDMLDLTSASRLFIILLMFIGAAPGATSGGIKITTAFIVVVGLLSFVKSESQIQIWGRTIDLPNILKAFSILVVSIIIILTLTIILVFLENKIEIGKLIFETVSAFGTVGFSVGINSSVGNISKLIFVALMFLGRIGPLSLFFIYTLQRRTPRGPKIIYPQEKVIVG